MAKTRSQKDDPVPQWLLRYEEATEQWLSRMEARFQEANDQWISRMEAMVADWRVPMKQKEQRSNQRSDDQSTLDRSSTPSMKTNLEEKSTSHFQVQIANSEIVRISEPGKVDLGLEKLEHAVMYENLEQEWDQMNVNEKLEVDGEVERGQKMIRYTEDGCAHKVLVKMPSKEKHMKHLKAWKFKFKPTSKRSRLMDDKFSFVEATVLLNKDPQEIVWDCVNKELKETVAGCGKTRVDRFKLVHATSRPGVYDKPLQSSVWDRGGSLLECVDEESFGDDKIKEWLFKVEEFFSIDFTPMALKGKLASNHFDGDAANWHQSQVQTGHLLTDWGAYKVLLKERFENVFEDSIAELKQLQETKEVEDEIEPVTDKEMLVMPQIAINANLGFSDYNNKRMTGGNKLGVMWLRKVEPITWRFKKLEMRFMMSKQKELPRESEAEVFSLNCNSLVTTTLLEVGQLLRQFQELFEKPSLASMMFEQTFSSNTEPKKILPLFFRLKHKWRSRLSHSFSEMKQRMIGRVWKSSGYLMEDMMEEDQKLQGDSEPLLTVPDFAAKICETFDQCIRKKRSVSADRESGSNQPTLRFSTWVIEVLLNHYVVLLLTPVAYAIHFLGGVGMDKAQSHLSLWINRVWDPGRSLIKDEDLIQHLPQHLFHCYVKNHLPTR